MGSLIAAAVARAHGFLLEPAVKTERPAPAPIPTSAATPGSVQVAVTGLSSRSGATTIAAGLAQALSVPGARSAHLVELTPAAGRRAPPGVVRWELPAALRSAGEIADYGATLARLAAGGDEAALVWDVPADGVARAAEVLAACHALVCVAEASAEPALCALVGDMLAERYGRVLLVANRVRDEEAWAGRCAVAVPESRIGAMLVARGRPPAGAMGEALVRVAAAVENVS